MFGFSLCDFLLCFTPFPMYKGLFVANKNGLVLVSWIQVRPRAIMWILLVVRRLKV